MATFLHKTSLRKISHHVWMSTLAIGITSIAISLGAYGNAEAGLERDTLSDGTQTLPLETNWEGNAVVSFTQRGNDQYRVGYFIDDGVIVPEQSLLSDAAAAVDSLNLAIEAHGEAFSTVIAHGEDTDITLTGSIKAWDDSEGRNASDFSGLGAMVIASDHAKVTLDAMDIQTRGFVRAAFIADEYANILVKDSTIQTLGANPLTNAYEGYLNGANINRMISPPWVLGIQGGVRTGNMLGTQPTLTVLNSDIRAGAWGVLSIDGSRSPMMNVVDSQLSILTEAEGGMTSGDFSYSDHYGTGYGSYAIGGAVQNFYGTTIGGVTYATIFTGGTANFASSTGDIALYDAQGNALPVVGGAAQPSRINAVWGFMSHGNAVLNVTDGTEVNSSEATFLYKSGSVDITFDDATLNPASGVILQMIDNDDRIVGGAMEAFNTTFNEKEGWPSENGEITSQMDIATDGAMDGHPCAPPAGMPPMGAPPAGMPPMGAPPEGMPPMGAPPEGCPPPPGCPPMHAGEGAGTSLEGNPPAGMPPMGAPPAGMLPPGCAPDGLESNSDDGSVNSAVVGPDGLPINSPQRQPIQNGAHITFVNGDYQGDIFNGTGYYGQAAAPLRVIIGDDAHVKGAISLTETRHIDETGAQNTHFTINEYYYLGHVANRNFRNGNATIAVTVKDDAVWTVTDESLLSELVLESGTITGEDGKTVVLHIDGVETELKAGTSYQGEIILSLR